MKFLSWTAAALISLSSSLGMASPGLYSCQTEDGSKALTLVYAIGGAMTEYVREEGHNLYRVVRGGIAKRVLDGASEDLGTYSVFETTGRDWKLALSIYWNHVSEENDGVHSMTATGDDGIAVTEALTCKVLPGLPKPSD